MLVARLLGTSRDIGLMPDREVMHHMKGSVVPRQFYMVLRPANHLQLEGEQSLNTACSSQLAREAGRWVMNALSRVVPPGLREYGHLPVRHGKAGRSIAVQ